MRIRKGVAILAGLLLMVLVLGAFALDVDNKDKVALFSNIEIPKGITVNGDAVAIFGNVTVNGDLTGDTVAIFGNVSVLGTVDGDAVAVFGKIDVKDGGAINGDAVGVFGGVEKAPNGSLRGEIVDVNTPFEFKGHDGILPKISYGDIVGLTVIYAFSCLALLIAPDRVRYMSEQSYQRLGRRFGIGFLITVLFVPASVVLSILLAITVIGIVFIPFIFIAFVLVAFAGMVALEVAIGYRITGSLEGRNAMFIHLLVGVVLVYALRMIPVFGWLAYTALAAYALGVAVDTRLGKPSAGKQVPNA